MLDFLIVSMRPGKRGVTEIYPRFIIKKSSDLMIRGGDFYAIWDEENKRWSTDEEDVFRLIDAELDKFYNEQKESHNGPLKVLHLWDAETGMVDTWHRYCQKQLRDSFHMLDENLMFSNTNITKKDYASKCLPYPLEDGDISAYNKLISTLYAPEEREKIEWAIGSIVAGDSKKIQKFLVLYGDSGTGKSTILNVIQQLFDGYYSVFDAKSLGSSNNQFALEAFSSNPLVAIQHDGDLSHIEDNTRLNSLVSHETMVVNEKHKNLYKNSFKSFLFMGTNKPVKITDAKSGIIRRLIDVSPSGNLLSKREYKTVTKQIEFELGHIAWHCREVYLSDPGKYDDYIPVKMMGASNDFYNFMLDSYTQFDTNDGVSLKAAWEMYKTFCEETRVTYPLSQRVFKTELSSYFEDLEDRHQFDDGSRVRNYYSGFKKNKFESKISREEESAKVDGIDFQEQESMFDVMAAEFPAQYASAKETPLVSWDRVSTKLSELDTHKLHYVKVPENHIVIDFDIPDDDGNKCFERNLEEASKWPATYAELSKSGAGIHLHYWYPGDVSKLSRIYAEHIEVKVFNGNSSLRRKLTKCNNLPIATIASGLPIKEEKKKVDGVKIKSQRKLFEMIERNLNKEIHGGTKPSCDFIYKIVEDAYNDGVRYDIPDSLKKRILDFAAGSTHHAKECVKLMKKMHYYSDDSERAMEEKFKTNSYEAREFIKNALDAVQSIKLKFDRINEYLLNMYNDGLLYDVRDIRHTLLYEASNAGQDAQYCLSVLNGMHFCSDQPLESTEKDNGKAIVIYDIEVYPNLFLVCWKLYGEGNPVIRWYNPTPEQIEELLQFRLVGYNCRRYDNHEIYGKLMGYDVAQLYRLSQRIINNQTGFFSEAYNLSYTDVYDFASAANKCSLKKAEIEMGIHHQEMEFDWNQPVPEDKWELVGDYCENDVLATEKRFDWLKADWTARQILADIAGMTVNDTTNTLTTRIIFGTNREPQNQFNYRDLSKPVKTMDEDMMRFLSEACPDMMSYQHGPARSLLPYFPGYTYDAGRSMYRGEDVGSGGYVYAEPGIYTNVALLDVASMHPHSLIAECLFGIVYTSAFRDIVEARVYIKHEQWSKVEKMLGGKLKPYIEKVKNGEMSSKDLSNALKTAINSVYGLTSAGFTNPFKDKRNKDNIVAKRGALFMVDLKHAVQEKGFTVAHIKTDSIKIPNATPEIIQFVMDFGKMYGYTFEHEATYEKMCLVNDAVYIAKYADGDHEYVLSTGEKIKTPWTATGTQFMVPYVFKTLFAKVPTNFNDFCETKSVTTALYLDLNENLPEGEHNYKFVGKVGQFSPVANGIGGGELVRISSDGSKYSSATGAKDYRWLESEVIRSLYVDNCETDYWMDKIDMSYYKSQIDKAVEAISQYGDFEWFSN